MAMTTTAATTTTAVTIIIITMPLVKVKRFQMWELLLPMPPPMMITMMRKGCNSVGRRHHRR